MPVELTRILSDIHYGDRVSRVAKLAQLRPLLDGVNHLVLNGDTLDTRAGPNPVHTAECQTTVLDFFRREAATTTYLTGNHDADFAPDHFLDLAEETVFVAHGDIFFDDLVPWSNDARLIRQRIAAELRDSPGASLDSLPARCELFRRVAASIPQRHQAERNRFKYALRYLGETVWPPTRILKIIQTWRLAPRRAAELSKTFRPRARFVVTGHTHRPGVWGMQDGVVVINTGSYCPPLGGLAVDVTAEAIYVREVVSRAGEFRIGGLRAEFPLARSPASAKTSA